MQAKPFDPARLAPDVRAVLEAMNESGAPPLDTLPIAEMREAYKQIGATLGGEVLPVGEVRDIKAMGPAGAIPLRLYVPQTPSSPGAATVYIHGGGWSLGDLDSHDKVCRRLVHNSGVTVVAIGYRLAPEYPAPAGPDDVVAAIRWLAEHAGEFALDPQRLAVAGDSAGGSLAAVATQQLRDEGQFRAQVLFYPCGDLSPTGWAFSSRVENGNVPPLTLDAMHAMSDPFVSDIDPRDPRVSPLLASTFDRLPPALIFSGECDALRDDGRLYRDALQSAGVPVDYVEILGMVHGFIEMAGVLNTAVEASERAGAFLRQNLS